MSYSTQNAEIRLATRRDVEAALRTDDGYTTTAIWQMDTQLAMRALAEMPLGAAQAGETSFGVIFRPVRLPRPRRVEGFRARRSPAERATSWEAAGCVLVIGPPDLREVPERFAALSGAPRAEYGGAEEPEVWGHAVASVVPRSRLAWLAELAVAEEQRRRGLGTILLNAALAWVRAPESHGGGGGAAALMMELSPHNSPAIGFCRAGGFAFCGYTDYSHAGGETSLLFTREIV